MKIVVLSKKLITEATDAGLNASRTLALTLVLITPH